MPLPPNTDALRGLRAARWIRESKRDQEDNFGPDAQREHQDRAIARYGLIDTGIAWEFPHSGTTIDRAPQFAEMLARAGTDYDVLVVGYVSRFARNLRTAVNARHDLHERGAVILFCDDRLLSSDDHDWKEWASEATEAENYSRKLGRRIREGHAAKFGRHGDRAGNAPLGFRRQDEKPFLLEIDRETIGRGVRLYERYAAETISYARLGREEELTEAAVREILQNPLYNGWQVMHEEPKPAPWRDHPPVSDHLWNEVQARRAARRTRTTPRRHHRPLPLQGKITCADCGGIYKHNGTNGSGIPTLFHRCAGRGRTFYTPAVVAPLEAQIEQVVISDAVAAQVMGALRTPTPVAPPDTSLMRRKLAQRHADGLLSDAEYLDQMSVLRAPPMTPEPIPTTYTAAEIMAALRDFETTWRAASSESRATLLDRTYAHVEASGERVTRVTLTTDAEALGLALALPERVTVAVARPAGIEPAT